MYKLRVYTGKTTQIGLVTEIEYQDRGYEDLNYAVEDFREEMHRVIDGTIQRVELWDHDGGKTLAACDRDGIREAE